MLRSLIVAFIVLFPLVARAQCKAQTVVVPVPTPYTDAQAVAAAQGAGFITAAQAPVQSVNAQTGTVTLPLMRATCTITNFDGSGNGSCAFGNFTGGTAFTSAPDCDARITAGNTSYVYSNTIQTAISATSVSTNTEAALKLLSISLGALTVWTTPPTGTVLTMICRGS